MANISDKFSWEDEDRYWEGNYRSRPYGASGDYSTYRPGYRYGFESASRHSGRDWNDVEGDLQSGWNTYEHRGSSTWEQVKDAVRDAWDRVTGRRHVGAR